MGSTWARLSNHVIKFPQQRKRQRHSIRPNGCTGAGACPWREDNRLCRTGTRAAWRSGQVRALIRYSAPDGTVEWHKVPDDIEFTPASGWRKGLSEKWTREMREHWPQVWVYRADVERLWPSGEQTSVPATGANPRGAGAKQKYDREFILTEAAAYVLENGLPVDSRRAGAQAPNRTRQQDAGDTQAKEILRRFFGARSKYWASVINSR